MATWLDGPEYAPTARPDEFAEPQVAPLEEPPAVPALVGAPLERPRFSDPSAPVPPLASLIPVPAEQRDPAQAFDVVSSTVTAGGPWGDIHGTLPAAAPTGAAPPWTPGPSCPVPAVPSGPGSPYASTFPSASTFPGASSSRSAPGLTQAPPGFPEPGTPQWFGPGPYGEQPSRARADARSLWAAATPALLIVLAAAVLIKVLAPLLLVGGFFLARRVLVGRAAVHRAFLVALGTLATFALIGLFTGPLSVEDWWSFVGTWSRLISLGALVATVVLVRRALLAGETPVSDQSPPSSDYRGPWG
ncbi:hypothetical protein [uncultured Friedmanniella sp.]|uniref:hypothetical protein n=1 Tax=uncultured Friedmanniella sp. TaxID=335381 RepID=UPI0035CC6C83